MKYFFVIFLFVVVTKFNMGVNADCCYQTKLVYHVEDHDCSKIKGGRPCSSEKSNPNSTCCEIKVCDDGDYYGYYYCAHGSCDIFGCNCKGGCIQGDGKSPIENFNDKNGHMVTDLMMYTTSDNPINKLFHRK